MIALRPSAARGRADHGWLKTRFSFSFADYYDPEHVQWGPLRVLNEDHIAGGAGFPTHPHQEMEIVTYVLSGSLAHKDSTGGAGLIRAGEVQRMSAGTGIAHSEFNADPKETLHLLQVWFVPGTRRLRPGYEQRGLGLDAKDRLLPAATPEGEGGALKIHQDVSFHVCDLTRGKSVAHKIAAGRLGYLHNAEFGKLAVGGRRLGPGGGLKIEGPETLNIRAESDARFVLFDMGRS